MAAAGGPPARGAGLSARPAGTSTHSRTQAARLLRKGPSWKRETVAQSFTGVMSAASAACSGGGIGIFSEGLRLPFRQNFDHPMIEVVHGMFENWSEAPYIFFPGFVNVAAEADTNVFVLPRQLHIFRPQQVDVLHGNFRMTVRAAVQFLLLRRQVLDPKHRWRRGNRHGRFGRGCRRRGNRRFGRYQRTSSSCRGSKFMHRCRFGFKLWRNQWPADRFRYRLLHKRWSRRRWRGFNHRRRSRAHGLGFRLRNVRNRRLRWRRSGGCRDRFRRHKTLRHRTRRGGRRHRRNRFRCRSFSGWQGGYIGLGGARATRLQ